MRDRRLFSLFEIPIEHVAVDQRYDEGRAQKNDGRAEMISPARVHAVNRQRGVERERETKELIENAQPDAGAPFQNSADGKRDKKCPDKNDDRYGGFLRLKQRGKHRLARSEHTNRRGLRQARENFHRTTITKDARGSA